jgi:hypothetical protein
LQVADDDVMMMEGGRYHKVILIMPEVRAGDGDASNASSGF